MSPKTYTIEIADATGHSVVQMTKTELISEASKAKGSWIFVDNKMVATDELANTDFDSAQHIRMVPALQAGSEDKMYTIEIADATGHSVVQMTKSDLIQQASNAKGSWVFVDNKMVAAAELADTDFDTAQHIRMVPALQAGQ
ncbi:MAG: hypothetical protein L7U62_05120 [Candidatus Poseidoniaceae archaeon]|nr:hypothetical protein [Candidatus Poseidoniaceae archaeon]